MNTITIQYPGEFVANFHTDSNLSFENILEQIFSEWNAGSGCECELFKRSYVRSLSVNDFVCINDKWFQVASVGWRPVTQEFVNKVETAVVNHPYFKDGAWFALHEVMREWNFGLRADWNDEPVTVLS